MMATQQSDVVRDSQGWPAWHGQAWEGLLRARMNLKRCSLISKSGKKGKKLAPVLVIVGNSVLTYGRWVL